MGRRERKAERARWFEYLARVNEHEKNGKKCPICGSPIVMKPRQKKKVKYMWVKCPNCGEAWIPRRRAYSRIDYAAMFVDYVGNGVSL